MTWKPQCDLLKWPGIVHQAPLWCGQLLQLLFSSSVSETNLCHEVRAPSLQIFRFSTSSCFMSFVSGSTSSWIKDSLKCLQTLLSRVDLCCVRSTKLFIIKPHHFFFLCYLIAHLQERLDEYIKQWNGLVKVFRNERREGLIQARSIGAQKAKLGQVGANSHTSLVFGEGRRWVGKVRWW